MLSEEEIRQVLHASRVVPLSVANPHGPLGLEHLAAAVALAVGSSPETDRVQRSIELRRETWEKLAEMADATTRTASRRTTPSEIAAAIIEQAVGTLPQSS